MAAAVDRDRRSGGGAHRARRDYLAARVRVGEAERFLTQADGPRALDPELLAAFNAPLGRVSARGAEAVDAVARAIAPWRDLLARLFLAQGFLIAQAMRMMHAAPGGSMALDLAWAAAPLLLAAGLFSRVAAAALLAQLILMPDVAPGIADFWSALLLWVIVAGPGPIAIDGVLAPAMRSSALPGAEAVGRLYAAVARSGGPVLLALIRVWIAAVLAGPALTALGLTDALDGAAWVPAAPAMTLARWPGPALIAAVWLAAGFATRLAALTVLLSMPFAGLAPLDERLFWALMLGLPLLRGPGALAVDGAIGRWLRDAFPRVRDLSPETIAGLPRVVIVGGGFGGIAAARALLDTPCQVTLIDARNFTLFQPLLYQVATAGLSPADIATPIRAMFRHQPTARVLLGEATGVDPAGRRVTLADAEVSYDYLVLATGARHAYFGHDDWAQAAPGLKAVEDATEIRRRLLIAFEAAETARDEAERRAWLTFLVVGGGPTGVELAGAIAELAHHSLADEFRAADPTLARVILVQADKRILPTFPPALSERAARSLRSLGVEVLTGRAVGAIDADGATLGEQRIAARTVLWAAGVMASPAGAWLGAETDRAGRLKVGPDLSVAGHRNVFGVGDTVASLAWDGKPVPGLAPAAKQGGAYVAGVIRARVLRRPPPPPFRYRHQGSLATIGRQSAVADFGWLRFSGAAAWWLWGGVHIAFLLGSRNRITVLVEWLWAYLTWRRSTRLITGPPGAATAPRPVVDIRRAAT